MAGPVECVAFGEFHLILVVNLCETEKLIHFIKFTVFYSCVRTELV